MSDTTGGWTSIDRKANPHPCYCGGSVRIVQDDLGCDVWECSNYPTCDESYYTHEQALVHQQAYYAANPDKREAFFQKRGFYPGETDPAKRSFRGGDSDNAHVCDDGSKGAGRKSGYRCIAPPLPPLPPRE